MAFTVFGLKTECKLQYLWIQLHRFRTKLLLLYFLYDFRIDFLKAILYTFKFLCQLDFCLPCGQVTCCTVSSEFIDCTRLQIVININNYDVEHKDVAPLLTNLDILCEYDTSHIKNLAFRNLFL
jgi:hypothetical protein